MNSGCGGASIDTDQPGIEGVHVVARHVRMDTLEGTLDAPRYVRRNKLMKKTLTLTSALVFLGWVVSGCQTTPVQDGALIGGALGAGSGAIIGHQSGYGGEGALIGAGAGALAGALIGDQVGQHRRKYHSQPQYYSPPRQSQVEHGRYVTRVVRTDSGETYEERVWVPDRR